MPTVKMTAEEIDHYAKLAIERGGTVGRPPMQPSAPPPASRREAGKGKVRTARSRNVVAEEFIKPGTWIIPLYVMTISNGALFSKHRIGRSGHERRAVHRTMARWYNELAPFVMHARRGGRVTVRIIRIGPRAMDYSNIVASVKYIQDAIADRFGLDDANKAFDWQYGPEKGKDYGIKIVMEKLSA